MAAGDVVGTAGGFVDLSGGFPELISMWVAPHWRGRGVATLLIEEVATWAGLAGFGELRLWIVEGNARAERAYAKAGFKRTGQRQPVHPDATAIQVEMARRL